MRKHAMGLAIALSFGAAGTAFAADAMTKEAYRAEKARIEAQAKTDQAACKTMKDNAKDVCAAEAKAKEKIAKAELYARNKPGAKADGKARLVRAEGEYEVAKEKCEDQQGDAMAACKRDARAAYDKARAEARSAQAGGAEAGRKS